VKVIIGVDPHKSVNAVAAIDGDGELLGHEVFPANRAGLRKLERWAKRFSERRWAVEGAAGIGRPAAQKLVGSGEEVVDVPPKLSARVRVLSSFAGNARKNDRLDATFTALAALRNERLARVASEDDADSARVEVLRLLIERRDDLVAERTRALNRLHVLLRHHSRRLRLMSGVRRREPSDLVQLMLFDHRYACCKLDMVQLGVLVCGAFLL
jgi:transposase